MIFDPEKHAIKILISIDLELQEIAEDLINNPIEEVLEDCYCWDCIEEPGV